MQKLKRYAALVLVCTLTLLTVPSARASAYDDHPKLIVIVVLDQFRADFLERYRADFKGRGFALFLDHGAWFSDCYYDYANTKTAPGHAAIGTGAYTDGNGIGGNSWWDLARDDKRPVSAVEDERYSLVGLPAGEKNAPGASPRNLLASTIGDQLRLATGGQSQVWGVSLKDRAAILATGATANGAFWIDPVSGRFITSSYYMTQLPDWAATFDDSGRIAQAEQEANAVGTKDFFEDVGSTTAAVGYEFDFAEALITGETLGTRSTPDLLVVSISPTDILGHRVGPDSPEQHAMIDAVDANLDAFFTWLDKNIQGGLGNVWIALTADHGVAPLPSTAATLGLNAARIDMKKLTDDVNYAINMRFSPGEKIPYLLPNESLPYLELNPPSFTRAGINEPEAEAAVQNALPAAFADLAKEAAQQAKPTPPQSSQPNQTIQPERNPTTPPNQTLPVTPTPKPGQTTQEPTTAANQTMAANPATQPEQPAAPAPAVAVKQPPVPKLFRSYTRVQLATGPLPDTQFGKLLAHSYSPNGGWYVMVIPDAFQMQGPGQSGTDHFTPYSYDRHVPRAFYGAPFAPGMYRGRVEPVDIAATFASLLGVNQPSASVGQILTQALKPESKVVYPKPPTARHHRRVRRPAAKKAAPKPAPKPAPGTKP
ncbi:MAG TPA: alkaline phosphatase family protein [Acidobacteriaceae bacterium]|nr:alkaline phosphatase family protein [Acidobacteriaceae bacterium]